MKLPHKKDFLVKALFTTLVKFENRGHTLKTHQLLSVHNTLEKSENAAGHFVCLRITQSEKLRDYRSVIVF